MIHETGVGGSDAEEWGWVCLCGEAEDGYELEEDAQEAARQHEEGAR